MWNSNQMIIWKKKEFYVEKIEKRWRKRTNTNNCHSSIKNNLSKNNQNSYCKYFYCHTGIWMLCKNKKIKNLTDVRAPSKLLIDIFFPPHNVYK